MFITPTPPSILRLSLDKEWNLLQSLQRILCVTSFSYISPIWAGGKGVETFPWIRHCYHCTVQTCRPYGEDFTLFLLMLNVKQRSREYRFKRCLILPNRESNSSLPFQRLPFTVSTADVLSIQLSMGGKYCTFFSCYCLSQNNFFQLRQKIILAEFRKEWSGVEIKIKDKINSALLWHLMTRDNFN